MGRGKSRGCSSNLLYRFLVACKKGETMTEVTHINAIEFKETPITDRWANLIFAHHIYRINLPYLMADTIALQIS